MKTPEECLDFITTWRYSMYRPSEEDLLEFFDSVEYYLKWSIREYPLRPTMFKGKPLGYAEDGFINTYCKPDSFVRDHMVNINMDDLKQTVEDCRISEGVPTIILDSIDSKVSSDLGE